MVPVEGQDWDSDPFELVREGDILRARGVTDMKGFVAAALTFATTVDIGPEDRPLHIVLTYDEETGCFGGERHRAISSKGNSARHSMSSG